MYDVCLLKEVRGKTLGERAALMAEKWRSLSKEEREKYDNQAQKANECPLETLSPKDIMMRIARHHQTDVCYECV